MTWQAFALALLVGLGVGAIYGLLNVRSPAPPVIALVGLLGILLGETAVGYLRGQPGPVSHAMHTKSFEAVKRPAASAAERERT